MTLTPHYNQILDQVEIGIDSSAYLQADWLEFNDPLFRWLEKVVVIDDPNPNNEGRTVHLIQAFELVMPDSWDEAPRWLYGVKAIGKYGLPSTSPMRWVEADKLMKPEHQHLIGEVEF